MEVFIYNNIEFNIITEFENKIRNEVNINLDLISYLHKKYDGSFTHPDAELHVIHIECLLYHLYKIINPSYLQYEEIKYLMDYYFCENKTICGANKFQNTNLLLLLEKYRYTKIHLKK